MDCGFTLCLWALMKMTMRENDFVRWKAIFLRKFQLSTSNNSSLLSDQDTNQFFWYKCGLNFRSLVQPLETLSIELIGTHVRKAIGMEHLH